MCLSAPGTLWPHIKFPVSGSMRQTQQVKNSGCHCLLFPRLIPKVIFRSVCKIAADRVYISSVIASLYITLYLQFHRGQQ